MRENHSDPLLRLDMPLQQALAWFTRLRDPFMSSDERQAFDAWYAASPSHVKAYQQVEQLWHSAALDIAIEQHVATAVPVIKQKPVKTQLWVSAFLLLVIVNVGLIYSGWIERWRADYYTVAGQQQRVRLADGTTVLLNSNTTLNLDFTDDHRGVNIVNGQAYFEVTPDPARPFVVSTELAKIQVVGTRFAVRTGNEVSVDVESGIVACAIDKGQTEQLTKGQHVTIDRRGITSPKPFDSERTFAWLKGRLIFRDQPLSVVIQELQRYHSGKIFIADKHLANIRITGNYKISDTQAVINTLSQITGANVTQLSPYLTVLSLPKAILL